LAITPIIYSYENRGISKAKNSLILILDFHNLHEFKSKFETALARESGDLRALFAENPEG
jgi:hypothetical protein